MLDFIDFLYEREEPGSTKGVTMTGVHYSNRPDLSSVDGRMFGTGIKGQESKRLNDRYGGADQRIKKRSYFYSVKPGEKTSGMHEQGLGQHTYTAHLHNVLDFETAHPSETKPVHDTTEKYVRDGDDRGNAFEKAVLDHGYKGYHSRGIVAMLGHDTIPVHYEGQRRELHK